MMSFAVPPAPAASATVDPAEVVAVFSHNLLGDVTCIAGLAHLIAASHGGDGGGYGVTGYVAELTARTEQLVERLRLGVQGMAVPAP